MLLAVLLKLPPGLLLASYCCQIAGRWLPESCQANPMGEWIRRRLSPFPDAASLNCRQYKITVF